jgi:hypothetical protein
MASVRPWPEVLEEDKWLIELMEERFEKTPLSPEELRARAAELRRQADETDMTAFREMALALAERYEETAASRLTRR